jgi:hypothetical protein
VLVSARIAIERRYRSDLVVGAEMREQLGVNFSVQYQVRI